MVKRLLLVLVVGILGAAVVAPAAHAAFGIEKWESLTCSENANTPVTFGVPEANAPQPGQCTGETSAKLFTQAGGHPTFGVTDFTLNTFPFASGIGGFPEGFVKDIIVDTPEGLSVNPEAAPQCTLEQLASPTHCPQNTIVGINYLTIALASPNSEVPPKCEFPPGTPVPLCPQARVALPVYNMDPVPRGALDGRLPDRNGRRPSSSAR